MSPSLPETCLTAATAELRYGNTDTVTQIGTCVRDRLREQVPLGKSFFISMTFHLDWDPTSVLREWGLDPALPNVLEDLFCLTGSRHEAQATTLMEYMAQTWPRTWQPIIYLAEKLIPLPAGEDFYCKGSPTVCILASRN